MDAMLVQGFYEKEKPLFKGAVWGVGVAYRREE